MDLEVFFVDSKHIEPRSAPDTSALEGVARWGSRE